MQDTTKVQSEQESLDVIQRVAGKTPPPQPKNDTSDAPSELTLDEVALPELTDEFNAKKKVRRSIPFQLVFLGTFVMGFLSLVRGCSTMSQSNANSDQEQAVASAPLAESERQELLDVINEQNLAIQELKQGNRIDIRTGKNKGLPKPTVNPATVNRVNSRRTPPPSTTTARSIPVRRPAPRFQPAPAKPKVVYKDRIVYKSAPTPPKPAPVAQSQPTPISRISLSKRHQPTAAKPKTRPISIKRVPQTPIRKPTVVAQTPKPKLTSAESGVLVASNAMTGDLIKDMSATGSPEAQGTPTPTQTSLVSGSIPAGTKVKAAFVNPLTWVAGNEGPAGQRVLLRLKEDLGGFAKKGSTAIGQVISVQGDFAQVQIVEINGQPIEHVNLKEPEGSTRTQPVAIVQYKDTPYKRSEGQEFRRARTGR